MIPPEYPDKCIFFYAIQEFQTIYMGFVDDIQGLIVLGEAKDELPWVR